MSEFSKKDRIMLVAGGILVMLTQLSISANCFSIFIIPISESLGIARGVFSWTQSCLSLGGMIASLNSGKIFNKFGVVRCMRFAGICSTCLYVLQSFALGLGHFYVINFAIGFFNTFCTSIPLSLLIGERFSQKRNMVVGIVMMGSGLGTSLFNTLASSFILKWGWRPAIRVLGLIMAAVAFTSYFVLIREISNGGASNKGAAPVKQDEKTVPAASAPRFFTPRNTWICVLCCLISIGAGSFMYTITPHLQDIGFSQTYAASVYSASMLFMAVGKIFHGMIIDRWGVRVSNSVLLITASVGVIGVLTYRSLFGAALICIGMMFISSLSVVGAPALAEALGGVDNKKYYVGKIAAFISLGYCLAPFIYGSVYDRVGTYVPMYYAALALFAVSLAGVLILLPKKNAQQQ